MRSDAYPSRTPAPEKKPKRYGWFRKYNGFPSHPKWRAIARKTGIHVSRVVHVIDCLFDCASKNRKGGWIGNFDFEDCAETCDMPVTEVLMIYRELDEREWLAEEFIGDWGERQPDMEDPTAAERQQRRRARIKVRKKIAAGVQITEHEAALLTSRVTPAGTPPPKPAQMQPLGVFLRVTPEDPDNPEAVNVARIATAANARVYLLGSGTNGPTDWGTAAAVVADKAGMRVFAADTTIRRWLSELGGDVGALAEIIDNTNHGGVCGEAFIRVVQQGIARVAIEKQRGAQLPFPPAAIAGGKHG
jgi:hypothetical protein